jgi:hypothetical protein
VVLLFRSSEVVLQYSELLCEAGVTNQIDASRVSQGITTELLAAMAGIVMGVLALLGIAPTTLLSAAVVTYGAAMLLTSGESLCLDSLDLKENDVVRQLIRR